MNIRTMTAADIPFAMRLKAQNNWNQLETDWRRQLELEPSLCFVAENATRGPLGTACACVLGDVAWVNFVLVEQTERGKGVGTALMKHVLQHLDARGVPTIRLDATPLGAPVYEKLGFTGEFTLDRYEGVLPEKDTAPLPEGKDIERVMPMTGSDLPAALAMDHAVTAARRDRLLQHLLTKAPTKALQWAPGGRFKGYCMWRPGANAWHIGPMQGSVGAGLRLLSAVSRRLAGERVYLDIPRSHEVAVIVAQSLGLKLQRSFLRMNRGINVAEREHLHLFWSSSGPEKG